MNRQANAGFTLIELVIVIVILGIIAAVAAPRFIDLSQEAEESALQAQAASLSSASALNFAAFRAGSDEASDIGDCEDIAGLTDGFDDSRYTIGGGSIDSGDTETCTVTQESTGNDRSFVGHGVDTSD